MLDPVLLHKLTHARPAAELVAQLTQLDPQLALPAALPLLAARLLGAQDFEEDDEPGDAEAASA
jgi:hypothetical protein